MQNAHLDWKKFLNRPAISVDDSSIQFALRGKRILITGAGGCIGAALTQQCAQLQIENLVLLDSSEKGIYDLDCDLAEMGCNVARAAIVGDVCDQALLEEIFAVHRPDIVFHAAACKHVPLMEINPFMAARTNAVGTLRLANAAMSYRVEQFILLSTDKAVEPVSIMGATKRIAELIVLANSSQTQMKAVRLGNVLASSGSVVPLFLKQIAMAGSVTVTHPDATRYFITLDEAVSLLLSAVLDPDAALLVPEPGGARRIADLARFLIAQADATTEIPIVFTQLRPGDKLHECLISNRESFLESTQEPLRGIRSPAVIETTLRHALEKTVESCEERDLEGLLQAICTMVPEYHPGAWLRSQAEPSNREIQ